MNRVWKSGKFKITLAALALLLVVFVFALPDPLFENPYSTVLEDKDGSLLSATIATDGQWRFPEQELVPDKFKTSITLFEDKRFYNHFGVDPLATMRAIQQNLKSGSIVSGGSTITMQVIRLMRKNHSRTFLEKLIEMFLATRLELSYSKDEILSLYAAHAPFGGNVVGIEAASWRYFGRKLNDLSWAESALLAVLPNNPSLIHLGKNRSLLKEKRDKLLSRLRGGENIDDVTFGLAIEEALPQNPLPLPRYARHLLSRATQEGHRGSRIKSSIDEAIQIGAERILSDHHERLKGNQVFNAAAIIIKVKSGEAIAYIGNTDAGKEHSDRVDVVNAPRSTGSILKPFLFAAMMDDGKLLPQTLVPDVPTVISGFSPKNFSREYDGAVAADEALIRSLNIPAVHELRDYRYEKFYELLKNVGLTTLTKAPDHYGLSLVLGGAEGTLWDIAGGYASMARTLNNYFEKPGKKRYRKADFHQPTYYRNEKLDSANELTETSWLSAAGIWLTFETLRELYRPGEETGWRQFSSTKPIAWKTGTSFGFRDGWAVGTNPEYTVGVWVGNADGEGRPGLTGTEMAAPILFDLFALLPGQPWFQQPQSELIQIEVCSKSGQRISSNCEARKLIWVTERGLTTTSCTYHKKIHLSLDKNFRVNLNCEKEERMKTLNWFVLPPVQEYYYRPKNLSYKPLPPVRVDCAEEGSLTTVMELIYPKPEASIFIPRDLDGTPGQVLFQVAHRSANTTIYWHLDGDYIGSTQRIHHMSLSGGKGPHTLTLVDDKGEILSQPFNIISDHN